MDLGNRMDAMGKQLNALVLLTAVLSIGGIVTSVAPALDGEVYGYTRIALGILGIAAAAVLLFGNDHGKTGLTLVMAWAAIQSIYYASEPDGNLTRQLIDGLMGGSNSTTINGEVTSFSAIGINLVGLGMLIFAYACRSQITRWRNRAPQGAAA